MAVDPDGNPHIVWYGYFKYGYRVDHIYYSTSEGSGWTSPQIISPYTMNNSNPEISLDPSGNPHVAWIGNDGTDEHVFRSSNTGSGWVSPRDISPSSSSNQAPQIAVDSAGNNHAAWTGDAGGTSHAWYSCGESLDYPYRYFFAEGYTRDGFDTWLTLQNPGNGSIAVEARFMLSGMLPIDRTYPVPAGSRCTINVNSEVGAGMDVSVRLRSKHEFYAERPMYFDYKGGVPGYAWDGGHVSAGAIAPARDWYFAEGCTRGGFEEWLCVQNPNDKKIAISVDYITAGGYVLRKDYAAEASSRISIFVNGDVGPDQDVSAHVHCDDPIVVERPMYFNYQGKWVGAMWSWGPIRPGTSGTSRRALRGTASIFGWRCRTQTTRTHT
ncbi:MAG: hypothetical protein AB1384_00250 [Actinomycetota bacterium]